ncbi:MAG: hypothetical protein DMG65_05135 [Candidatus Angelobacter sp. Gp1-AA117]|nr:MAG: hypothetical protein DMG65_05135 [Candidatus Angelobacter sp. Gp1-AA117]
MDSKAHLRDVKLKDIYTPLFKRLHICAVNHFYAAGKANSIVDGLSAEDLASEVLTEFLQNKYKSWDENKGALEVYLMGILRNKWVDHLRRQTRTPCSIDDEKASHEITEGPEYKWEPEKKIYLRDIIDHARAVDPEFVAAAENLEEGHDSNKQLAKALYTTPSKIFNRKKKLKRQVAQRISHQKKKSRGRMGQW